MQKRLAIISLIFLAACVKPAPVGDKNELLSYLLAPSFERLGSNAIFDLDHFAELPRAAEVQKADKLLGRKKYREALEVLDGAFTPAAHYLRAVAQRHLGLLDQAEQSLELAYGDGALADLLQLERGQLALKQHRMMDAKRDLLTVLESGSVWSQAAAMPLVQALAEDPQALLEHFGKLDAVIANSDDRSQLFLAKALALEKLGRKEEALAVHSQRYLQEPISSFTPDQPPVDAMITPEQYLARAQKLLDAHRNERALHAFKDIDDALLDPNQFCQKAFGLGIAFRKLRKYDEAEKKLGWVFESCHDEDIRRRALYTRAKVQSIQSGLQAIDTIELFAKTYPKHSMHDDVLFWAGDMYQRRSKTPEAVSYYQRIVAIPNGDHCGEAAWRLAQLMYQQDDYEQSSKLFKDILKPSENCEESIDGVARARYWLAKSLLKLDRPDEAKIYLRTLVQHMPLHFYSQMALVILQDLEPSYEPPALPRDNTNLLLCPGSLIAQPAFVRGLHLLTRGLTTQAAQEFLSVKPPQKKTKCPTDKSTLLLTLLLDKAEAHKEAHLRLESYLGERLLQVPAGNGVRLLKVAYPLGFRDAIEQSEHEHQIPIFALQALAREESTLDPEIVSWAGAYGLTQLLVSTGARIGERVYPKVIVKSGDDLLDPNINARLGGALLGSLLKRYHGQYALALTAYNAGENVADSLAHRYGGKPFDEFVEAIGIKETRGYVKRVLQTYGIYRWLYAGESLRSPVAPTLAATP
jgi:soluble lytic murein transglycosylase